MVLSTKVSDDAFSVALENKPYACIFKQVNAYNKNKKIISIIQVNILPHCISREHV